MRDKDSGHHDIAELRFESSFLHKFTKIGWNCSWLENNIFLTKSTRTFVLCCSSFIIILSVFASLKSVSDLFHFSLTSLVLMDSLLECLMLHISDPHCLKYLIGKVVCYFSLISRFSTPADQNSSNFIPSEKLIIGF